MKNNFWVSLNKKVKKEGRPIFTLAPMANVTDAAFRRIIAKYGKPDVMWTEFVSADGLFLRPVRSRESLDLRSRFAKAAASYGVGGDNPLLYDLEYSESERPIVAQFFTSRPEMMKKAARLAVKLGFDGIDINMGCPDRSIERQGSGAAHIKNPKLAKDIIRAAQDGAPDLPISVKTRIGYNKNQLEEWLPELLAENPAVVTIHARTRKEMSKVPARWQDVKQAVEIRDRLGSKTLIIGNGDLKDMANGRLRAKETGADGVMFGRAIFGNPWLFAETKNSTYQQTQVCWYVEERLKVMVEHTELFEKLLGDIKSFAIMKKHFKAYVTGWDGAKDLRNKLMNTENATEVEKIVADYLRAETIAVK